MMAALTDQQIFDWIKSSTRPDEPPGVTRARFEKLFGGDGSKADRAAMNANFETAMRWWAIFKAD